MKSRARLGPAIEGLLHSVKATPWAWFLVVANLLAVVWGYGHYYAPQLARTPWILWPFVPDSPNAVFLFACVLVLYRFRARHPALDLFAWALNIKVGIWTAFILLYYFQGFFQGREVTQWILFVLHIGMVAQAFVLHRDLRRDPPGRMAYAGLAFVFVFTDILDYFLPVYTCPGSGPGLHPCLPGPALPLVGTVTVLMSAAILALAFLLYTPKPPARTAHPPSDRARARAR